MKQRTTNNKQNGECRVRSERRLEFSRLMHLKIISFLRSMFFWETFRGSDNASRALLNKSRKPSRAATRKATVKSSDLWMEWIRVVHHFRLQGEVFLWIVCCGGSWLQLIWGRENKFWTIFALLSFALKVIAFVDAVNVSLTSSCQQKKRTISDFRSSFQNRSKE